ncbi:aminopeptidase [Paenibacillus cymbidii]|uniref:aminopeptidase n=1 Tax=Paenibacillus cymbidii TaxID=1639034 RepID=UPI00108056C2|nr:aminopeptidase [Paenibacillus cymbidii]
MNLFQKQMNHYAELAVRLGVNIQQNQTLVIDAPVCSAYFVRVLAEKAYDAGAQTVHVEWSDGEVQRSKLMRSSLESLADYPKWKAAGYVEWAQRGAAFLTIQAPQPGLMKDVPTERVALFQKTSGQATQAFRAYRMSEKVNWLVIALPTQRWADQIFCGWPGLTAEERLEKLWETVFAALRLNQDDPMEAWQSHIGRMKNRLMKLNRAQYKQLHFTAPGTCLTIQLPLNHVWIGGGSKTGDGVSFVPNLPTEECFTAPIRTGVNGTVRGTKPLYHGGKLIQEFAFTFREGKVIDFQADVGKQDLRSLFETDEGSCYLGEVALVPSTSPLAKENLAFYNTLFDENSSCHIAFGAAYAKNIAGGEKMTREQLLRHGINQSSQHVDFMIGSREMDVEAQAPSGEWVPLFRRGEWV